MVDAVLDCKECKKCGKWIVFVLLAKSRSVMPCEREIVPAAAGRTVVTRAGVIVRGYKADVEGHEPHWGYCRRPLVDQIADSMDERPYPEKTIKQIIEEAKG